MKEGRATVLLPDTLIATAPCRGRRSATNRGVRVHADFALETYTGRVPTSDLAASDQEAARDVYHLDPIVAVCNQALGTRLPGRRTTPGPKPLERAERGDFIRM